MPSTSSLQSIKLGSRVQHIAELRAAGLGRSDIEALLKDGSIARVRRGWYRAQDAHPDIVAAVRVGGALTATSAAALYGLWVPPDDRLHVSVPQNASRLRRPDPGASRAPLRPVCIHWSRSRASPSRSIESVPVILQQSLECLPDEMAIVLIDSALHLKVDGVTLASLGRLFEGLPARYRSALSRADPESESGIETLVRLRLRSLGISVRTQVRHRGVGRVDLLVGDRLVIEVDGREHHDSREAFASDRERDLVLFRDGFDRLRLTYAHVMYRWPEIEGVIVEAVRRRRHRWRMSDRPVPAPSSAVPPSATQTSATPSTAQFRKKSAQFRNSEKGATP